MLDSLALVVLLATCSVKLIVAAEPVESRFIACPCTLEQGIFPVLVFLLQCLVLVLLKNRQDFRVNGVDLGRRENWSFTPKILLEASFLPQIEYFLD